MSVLVANPCTSNASPKIYIAETAADIYFPRNGKPGDTVIVTKDSGFEIWKFKAEYDPIGTEGADWIAAKPCGYWVNIGNGDGRFQQFINVKSAPFNAVGDGEEDDTIAIQSAIEFASLFEVGSTVFFPSGAYRTTSQLNVAANWVHLIGPNNIGGLDSTTVVGATILGAASGMGAIIYFNKPGTAIYGVTVQNIRTAAISGLASPPDGLSFKDSSECVVKDCLLGTNLRNGLKTNGSDMLRLERVTISTNQVGILQTVENTTVFLGQANVQAVGLNIFEHSEASVKIDGYIDWTIYRDSFIEYSPYGFLFTTRTGADAYMEKFIADGVYFYNGSSTPYPDSRFMSFEAPAGAANYLGCHNFQVIGCKAWCYGATQAVDYVKGTNSHGSTAFTRQDFISNTFYGVSVSGIYTDSLVASGRLMGSHMVRDAYQSGSDMPIVDGPGFHLFEPTLTGVVGVGYIPVGGTNGLANSHIQITGDDVDIPFGDLSLSQGGLTIVNDDGGINLVTTDNSNFLAISFKQGNIMRARMELLAHDQNLQFVSDSAGGRDQGFSFFNNTLSSVVPILELAPDGKVGIGIAAPTSRLHVVGLPTYADNAAATGGGLTAGAFYATATGELRVVV